nr:hypothetical protein JVH1_3711 [Rhodococcus sp. JVH1]
MVPAHGPDGTTSADTTVDLPLDGVLPRISLTVIGAGDPGRAGVSLPI